LAETCSYFLPLNSIINPYYHSYVFLIDIYLTFSLSTHNGDDTPQKHGTNSKAIETSIIIASILAPSSRKSAMFWQIVTMCLSHKYPGLNQCWSLYYHLFISQTCLRYPAMTCPLCLQTTEIKLTVLYPYCCSVHFAESL